MSEEELTYRLRSRLHPTIKTGNTELAKPLVPTPPTILPSSEQSLGRLMERMDVLERQLKLIYKVVWRTSAALLGLAAASFGWDWVAKLLRSF